MHGRMGSALHLSSASQWWVHGQLISRYCGETSQLGFLSHAPDIHSTAKLKVKRAFNLPPSQVGPVGRGRDNPLGWAESGERMNTQKLGLGFLLLTNAFSGGCPSRGREPPKKGFKSSPL